MEQSRVKYSKIQIIFCFVDFLSSTANWLYLAEEDFQSSCSIPRYLIKVEEIQQENDYKNEIIALFLGICFKRRANLKIY